jgi:hypothetical protein
VKCHLFFQDLFLDIFPRLIFLGIETMVR